MKRFFPAVALTAGLALSAAAEPTDYDFADPKGVNGIVFILDSELEPIVGIGGGVSGTIGYDAEDPASFSGSISVAVSELKVVNTGMTNAMMKDDWLNVAANAQLTVEFGEVVEVETEGDGEAVVVVEGVLKFAGLEIEKEFEILATHIEDGAPGRGRASSGDLLVLRSEFTVSRSDLGIKPEMGPEKVAEEIHIIVPIAGYAK